MIMDDNKRLHNDLMKQVAANQEQKESLLSISSVLKEQMPNTSSKLIIHGDVDQTAKKLKKLVNVPDVITI